MTDFGAFADFMKAVVGSDSFGDGIAKGVSGLVNAEKQNAKAEPIDCEVIGVREVDDPRDYVAHEADDLGSVTPRRTRVLTESCGATDGPFACAGHDDAGRCLWRRS